MKKYCREFCFILPSIVAAIAAVVGLRLNVPEFSPISYPEENVVTKEEEPDVPVVEAGEDESSKNSDPSEKKLKKASYTESGVWNDGTFTGSGTGFGGLIRVSVTIEDGKITDIQILSCPGETPSYLEKAKAVIARMVAAQSPDVDMVSGATYSSNGIRSAVLQALNKAGGNLSSEPEPVSADKAVNVAVKKKTLPVSNNEPRDGVYSGSAVCERFGYKLSLKVRFKDGKAVSLYGLKITGNADKANEAYWEKAWKPMVKRILKAQSIDVDVVSGATYSSNAILEAYQNARAKAVKTTKNNDKNSTKVQATPSPAPIVLPDETVQTEGTAKDGVYTVSAVCEPDEENAFAPYTLTADVTFEGGKCTSIANFSSTDESNKGYYEKAAYGTARVSGVVSQILKTQSASGISAVSGATCSSKTIRTLYLQALSQATGTVQEDPVEEEGDLSSAQTPVPVPSATPTQTPVPAPSVVPEQTPSESDGADSVGAPIKDGTYTASAMVVADEWEEFGDYLLTADVTFSEGRLTGITNLVPGDITNQWYCNTAANGYGTKKGIIQQLIDRQNGNVDAVSGATCSSLALVQIYENALEMARK